MIASDLHSLRQKQCELVALLAKTKIQELYAEKFPSEALGKLSVRLILLTDYFLFFHLQTVQQNLEGQHL